MSIEKSIEKRKGRANNGGEKGQFFSSSRHPRECGDPLSTPIPPFFPRGD